MDENTKNLAMMAIDENVQHSCARKVIKYVFNLEIFGEDSRINRPSNKYLAKKFGWDEHTVRSAISFAKKTEFITTTGRGKTRTFELNVQFLRGKMGEIAARNLHKKASLKDLKIDENELHFTMQNLDDKARFSGEMGDVTGDATGDETGDKITGVKPLTIYIKDKYIYPGATDKVAPRAAKAADAVAIATDTFTGEPVKENCDFNSFISLNEDASATLTQPLPNSAPPSPACASAAPARGLPFEVDVSRERPTDVQATERRLSAIQAASLLKTVCKIIDPEHPNYNQSVQLRNAIKNRRKVFADDEIIEAAELYMSAYHNPDGWVERPSVYHFLRSEDTISSLLADKQAELRPKTEKLASINPNLPDAGVRFTVYDQARRLGDQAVLDLDPNDPDFLKRVKEIKNGGDGRCVQ